MFKSFKEKLMYKVALKRQLDYYKGYLAGINEAVETMRDILEQLKKLQKSLEELEKLKK